MQLNNTTINETDALYPYHSYLETLLSFNEGRQKKKKYFEQHFVGKTQDLPVNNFCDVEKQNEKELGWNSNPGVNARFQETKYSRPFKMMGRVHADLLFQEWLLPGNCDLKLCLHRADPSFALMAKSSINGFSIAIDSAVLWARCVDIAPTIREAHVKASLHNMYKFPIQKMKTLYFTFSQGRQDFSCL